MRRLTSGVLTAAVSSLLLTGCGGPVDSVDEPLPSRKGSSKITATVNVPRETRKLLDQNKYKYQGVIRGSVKWISDDKPDARQVLDMKENADYCLHGKKDGVVVSPIQPFETYQQNYRVGNNGNLGNVFVWIEPLSGEAFDVPDSQLPQNKQARLHQPHCAFLPHCLVVFASRYKDGDDDPTGCQKLVIENDARVAHNANVQGQGPLNKAVSGNKSLAAWDGSSRKAEETFELKAERDPVTIACNVHNWMNAYVRVFNHPYAAVTSVGAANLTEPGKQRWENLADPKFGTYEIKGVPIGAKVRLFAWHEKSGYLNGARGEEITLGEKMARNFEAKK